MNPFQAIQYVGTPLALAAFIVAVVAWVYRARLAERRKLIETAPEADRGRLLDATIRDFTTVETATLTREQRYQLALRLIEERAARTRIMAVAGIATAVIVSGVVLLLPSGASEPVGLVVRVSGADGEFITTGSVTVDAGSGRDTRPIGPDGQVRFDNLPPSVFAQGVSIIPQVSGYAQTAATLTEVPAGGVHYLQLERTTTPLIGTVIDAARTPLAGVVLTFEGGVASDTTDASGTFRVDLPQPPGSRIAVRALREGVVGFNDMVTIPEQGSVTLFFEAKT